MAEEEESQQSELSDEQKIEIAKWFLLNSPPGEIEYVAKDVRSVLNDESLYHKAASEAFPLYNKSHLVCLQMPKGSGDVLVTSFGEMSKNEYLDPRSAQVAIVDHVKQIRCHFVIGGKSGLSPEPTSLFVDNYSDAHSVCTKVRPARDEELPSAYIEEYRCSLDAEIGKYVSDAYPKGVHSVYCTNGKDNEPGSDFEFTIVISATRHSPQNFCNGSWRSIWNLEFKDDVQTVEVKGKLQVGAHYFEEGNVQLDAKQECKDSTIFQSPDDSAVALTNIIRTHETEYLDALQSSYSNLPDTTFKDLRRKLPVTRTQFPWHNTKQFNLNRDLSNELGIKK